MDNLPNNPSNPNSGNNLPPPFGSGFNPHTNPVDPNNPYQPQPPQPPPTSPTHPVDPAQSLVAQHQKRDEHGRFIKSENTVSSNPIHQTPPNPSTFSNPSLSSNLPPPISITENTKYSEKNDPPLVAVSVTNPVTYLKLFLKRLLKNEGIDIRLKIKPLTVVACVLALSTAFGTGFNVATFFFPNSSPVFHR